jgi:hypothetical protein
MIVDEIRALLLVHDRLKAWEQSFIRDMAKLLEQRRSLTNRQLTTIGRILDRYRVLTVPAQATPDQLTLLAGPVAHVIEALRPTRRAQPARKRVRRKQRRTARSGLRSMSGDADAPLVDDPLPW